MKKFTLLFAFAFTIFATTKVSAQVTNFDSFGYKFLTNKDSAGPSFEWVDITDTSTLRKGIKVTGLGDDNGVGPFNMGFNFQYYLASYNEITLGVNGWLSFAKGTVLAPTFPEIPTPGGKANNYIAPFMADLNFAGEGNPGNLYYWTNNVDSFVVTYDRVPYWVQESTHGGKQYGVGTNSFQVVFKGSDSSITLNYLAVADSNETASGFKAGIENVSGQIGLKCLDTDLPSDGTAIKFYYPATVTGVYKDVTVNWNQNEENAGFFVQKGTDTVSFITNIGNIGNTDMNLIQATAKVRKGTSTTIGTNSINVLTAGSDSTISIGKYVPKAEGAYTFEVSITAAGDGFAGNNKASSEFNVVDVAKKDFRLAYTNMDEAGGGVFGLSGSNTGSAILIVPPVYPFKITAAEFMAQEAQNTTAGSPLPGGFSFEIHDNSGPNGTPGNVLYNGTVPESETANIQLMTIALDSTITVNQGGVYLFFYANDNTVSIQTDINPPFSFRTFEAIGGQVSPYRNGDANDFKMGFVAKGTGIGMENTIENNKSILSQNTPNPANLNTNVNFKIAESGNVNFVISDVMGKVVNTIELGRMTAGNHNVKFNTSDLNSGIYFYSMNVNGNVITKKMIVNN